MGNSLTINSNHKPAVIHWFGFLHVLWLASGVVLLTDCASSPPTRLALSPTPSLAATAVPISAPLRTLTVQPSQTLRAVVLVALRPAGSLSAHTSARNSDTVGLSRLSFPVQPANVVAYAKGFHDYLATNITASAGSRFVAITSGIVDFVSETDEWDPKNG